MRAVARCAVVAAGVGSAVWIGGLAPAGADPILPVDPNLPPPSVIPALLGQAPLPPGTISSGPAADPLALAQLLMPQNFRMPTPDQVSPYELAPNLEPSPFARIDAWKGVHALLHGGLGRMPGDELGQPLPGTAPPPGSNLPPGLEQFYIDPAAAPAAAAPPFDLLPPPPPPA
jgi:hypothetical protein